MKTDADYASDIASVLIKLLPINTSPSMLILFNNGSVNYDRYTSTNITSIFPIKACLLRDKTIWSVTMVRNQIWGLSIYTTYRDGISGKAVRGDDIELWFKNNIIVM